MSNTYILALLIFGGLVLAYYLFCRIKAKSFVLLDHPFFIACVASFVLHGCLIWLAVIKDINVGGTSFFFMRMAVGILAIGIFVIAYKKYKKTDNAKCSP